MIEVSPGVFMRPFDRPEEFRVPPPDTVPCVFVGAQEFVAIQDKIQRAEDDVGTDLLVDGMGRQIVNCWDPFGHRWILLSKADAQRPYADGAPQRQPRPWHHRWQST